VSTCVRHSAHACVHGPIGQHSVDPPSRPGPGTRVGISAAGPARARLSLPPPWAERALQQGTAPAPRRAIYVTRSGWHGHNHGHGHGLRPGTTAPSIQCDCAPRLGQVGAGSHAKRAHMLPWEARARRRGFGPSLAAVATARSARPCPQFAITNAGPVKFIVGSFPPPPFPLPAGCLRRIIEGGRGSLTAGRGAAAQPHSVPPPAKTSRQRAPSQSPSAAAAGQCPST
jgi:hypothetical protein